jgi:hypothetical protein
MGPAGCYCTTVGRVDAARLLNVQIDIDRGRGGMFKFFAHSFGRNKYLRGLELKQGAAGAAPAGRNKPNVLWVVLRPAL